MPSSPPRLKFELDLLLRGLTRIAGVDEAGRGPLAGPVVAAAVLLPLNWLRNGLPPHLLDLNDSKQLTEHRRAEFHAILTSTPGLEYAVALVESPQIDALNILKATHQAMVSALAQLPSPPEHVLVDGLAVATIPYPQTALVQGDARSYSIAAASVLAKVTRDRIMLAHERSFPGYGFAQHKGYGTPEHLDALRRLGPCPIHRRSFAPLKPAQGELFPQ